MEHHAGQEFAGPLLRWAPHRRARATWPAACNGPRVGALPPMLLPFHERWHQDRPPRVLALIQRHHPQGLTSVAARGLHRRRDVSSTCGERAAIATGVRPTAYG